VAPPTTAGPAPAPEVALPPLEPVAIGTVAAAGTTDEFPAAPAPRWLAALAVSTTLVALAALTRRAQRHAALPPG
jgi:hypothetical protein